MFQPFFTKTEVCAVEVKQAWKGKNAHSSSFPQNEPVSAYNPQESVTDWTIPLAAQRAQLINSQYLPEKLADFRIYRAQLKRILESNLYFLEIKAGRKLLHKIGVTKRPIEERVMEVQRDESGSL